MQKTQIVKYSHFFVIRNPTRQMLPILYEFAANYTGMKYEYDPNLRKKKWMADKTYAIYVDGGYEFRFHLGQWIELIDVQFRNRVDPNAYEIVEMPIYEPATIDVEMRPGYDLYPQQVEAKEFALQNIRNGSRMPQLSMVTGSGKAMAYDSPIKIPGGWSTHGAVEAGTVVTAWDGTPSIVKGVYPQGKKPFYKLTFGDGRTTEAAGEHLWRVYTSDWGLKSKTRNTRNPRIIDTDEIARLNKINTYKGRIFIDLCDSEKCGPELNLPIDPYLLGLLIGDGALSNGQVRFCKDDGELHDYFRENIHESLEFLVRGGCETIIRARDRKVDPTHPLRDALKEFGLMGKRSWEKFIPEQYLDASHEQRLSLLCGLMDTDGYINIHSSMSYCTTSERLAKQVRFLVRSLGGIATISIKKNPTYTHNGEKRVGRWAYNVHIRHKRPSEFFRLKRKQDRANDENQYADRLKLLIRSVEYIGEKDCVCIEIDHPDHLYVTNDFIVTHNTVVASHIAAELKHRIGVVVLAGYVEKWITDLSTYLTLDKDEIGVVKGGKNLILASHWAETEEPPKAIVFSMDTMMTWFDLYEKDHNNPELDKYGCKPWELYQSLGIGLVIFDEMHQHLHKVYRTNTYLHAPGSVNLSATLIASDPMRRKVQNVMFPKTIRFEKIQMKKYITCHGCAYQIVDMANSGIRTSEFGNTSYSHNAFEESILKNKVLGKQYMDMLLKLIKEAYIDRRLEGDKCIVYVFRKSFAYELVKHLEKRYPELVIRTYVEGQPDENIKESDICLTTLGSGSTGHDVKGLRVAINTVSVDSPVANLQALGRLREFKSRDHDNDVHFYYLYCSSIPKHVDYHENKKVLYADRLKEYQNEFLTTLYPTDQRQH